MFLFLDHPLVILIVTILSFPIYELLKRAFFDDWADVWESIKFFFQPDIVSILLYKEDEDDFATSKLIAFFVISILWIIVASEIVCRIFF